MGNKINCGSHGTQEEEGEALQTSKTGTKKLPLHRLEMWLSSQEHWLLFQRTWVDSQH